MADGSQAPSEQPKSNGTSKDESETPTRNRRQRTGCLTCRRRRKRCDGARDVCGHCRRLNLVCHWQSPRDLEVAAAARRRSAQDQSISTVRIAPAPIQFLQSDACEPVRGSLDRKLALRYYVQTFTAVLTTNLENNGFLTVLLPMAIEDKPLLDMLVAWSSSHLSLCDDAYRVKALEHRSTALQSFTTSLLNNPESPELSLACCLVFCSMSAILGDTAGWHNHLLGAAHIIQRAGQSASHQDGLRRISSSYEGRWLLRNFAYHDILMSVTSDCDPLIPGQYWIAEPKSTIDTYFGLASGPMAKISEISALQQSTRRSITTPSGLGDSDSGSPSTFSDGLELDAAQLSTFANHALAIERELQAWTCPDSDDPCLVSLAEAYRSAALIHLYRVMRRQLTDTDVSGKTQEQVAAVVHHVGNMPLSCLPECTSLFPLFMAGGEARARPAMDFVRERLQHIATYRHFKNAASALSVLEELWLQHTSFTGLVAREPLDWLDILKRRDWSLALT